MNTLTSAQLEFYPKQFEANPMLGLLVQLLSCFRFWFCFAWRANGAKADPWTQVVGSSLASEGTPGRLGTREGQGFEGHIDLEGQGHFLPPFLERVWNSWELRVHLCAWELIFVFPGRSIQRTHFLPRADQTRAGDQ